MSLSDATTTLCTRAAEPVDRAPHRAASLPGGELAQHRPRDAGHRHRGQAHDVGSDAPQALLAQRLQRRAVAQRRQAGDLRVDPQHRAALGQLEGDVALRVEDAVPRRPGDDHHERVGHDATAGARSMLRIGYTLAAYTSATSVPPRKTWASVSSTSSATATPVARGQRPAGERARELGGDHAQRDAGAPERDPVGGDDDEQRHGGVRHGDGLDPALPDGQRQRRQQRDEPHGLEHEVRARGAERGQEVVDELAEHAGDGEHHQPRQRRGRRHPRLAVHEPHQRLGEEREHQAGGKRDEQERGAHRRERRRGVRLAVVQAREQRQRDPPGGRREHVHRPGREVEGQQVEPELDRAERRADHDVVDVQHRDHQQARPGEREPEGEQLAGQLGLEAEGVHARRVAQDEHAVDDAAEQRAGRQRPRALRRPRRARPRSRRRRRSRSCRRSSARAA